MNEKNIINNKGQINIAKDNATINATQNVYPKLFDINKEIMQPNLQMLSSNFVGREEYISKIDLLLKKRDIIVIYANGGLGKTQIALKYIDKHEKKYKHIAFINASSGDNITQEYSRLLDIENNENTISRTREWTNKNKNWLFVYDNLDDEALKENIYKSHMVNPKNGKIIITSRLNIWNEEKIEVDEFKQEESILLLNKVTKLNDDGAKELSKELNNFPLALEQAGVYVKNNKITYHDYIKIFRDKKYKLRILDKEKPDKYHSTILKTWQISFEKITNECSKELLNIISYLDSDNIPKQIFFEGIEDLPECLKKSLNDELDSKEVFKQLSKYSLVKLKDTNIFVHKLVQEVVRYSFKKEDFFKWFGITEKILYELFNYNYHKQDTWEWTLKLVPHIISVIKISNEYKIENTNLGNLNNEIGELYYYQGKYGEVESYLKKAVAIREKELGLNHPDTAMSYNNLGELYRVQGKYEEALVYYKKAVAIYEKELGLNHPDTAMNYNNLGALYFNLGKYEEVEFYFKKAVAIREKELGLNHPETAMSYNNLGASYFNLGKYEEAESYSKKDLDICEKELGLNHPETATSYNNLGLLYRVQGKYEKAESYFKKALVIREKELGLNHPSTKIIKESLEILYKEMKKES